MLTEEDKADARRTSPWNKPLLLTVGEFHIKHDESTLVAFQKTAGDPKYIGPVELKHVEESDLARHILTLDELYKLRSWVLEECRSNLPLFLDSEKIELETILVFLRYRYYQHLPKYTYLIPFHVPYYLLEYHNHK